MKKLVLIVLVLVFALSSMAAVKPELKRLVIQNRSNAPVSVILGEQYSFYVVNGEVSVFTVVEGEYNVTAYWCDEIVDIPEYNLTKNQRLTFAPCSVVRPLGEPGFLKVTLPYPE